MKFRWRWEYDLIYCAKCGRYCGAILKSLDRNDRFGFTVWSPTHGEVKSTLRYRDETSAKRGAERALQKMLSEK